jgi:hypothetical protein
MRNAPVFCAARSSFQPQIGVLTGDLARNLPGDFADASRTRTETATFAIGSQYKKQNPQPLRLRVCKTGLFLWS